VLVKSEDQFHMHLIENVARGGKRFLRLSDDSRLVCAIRPRYELVLQFLYGRKGLFRQLDGEEPIRLRPQDRLVPENYEPPVFHFLKERVKPGAVVLEVGANIGIFSVLMARWAGSNGVIHAFEPSPACCEVLTFHLGLNGVKDRVVIERAALSNSEGTATFYCSGTSGTNSLSAVRIHTACGATEETQVRVTTVDSYCFSRKVSPSLIKIDVEGFEFHVLEGAFDILKKCRPIILVEFHPVNWADIAVSPKSVMSALENLGYRARALSGQQNILSQYGHVVFESSV